MNDLLRIVLDTLFPPTQHEKRIRTLSTETFARLLRPTTIDRHIALSLYDIADVQAAVAACKFEKNIQAAKLLAALCDSWLEQNKQAGVTVLIPIPLSYKRRKERGFNQVERVLNNLPHHPSILIAPHLLKRVRDTKRQTSLGRTERISNLTGVFATQPQQLALIDWSSVTRVIICDDVLTTGATLTAARSALAPHLPSNITLVTLAWAH